VVQSVLLLLLLADFALLLLLLPLADVLASYLTQLMGYRRTKSQGVLRTSRGRGDATVAQRPDLSASDAFAAFLECLPRDAAPTAVSHLDYLRHLGGVLARAVRATGGASSTSGPESVGVLSNSGDERRAAAAAGWHSDSSTHHSVTEAPGSETHEAASTTVERDQPSPIPPPMVTCSSLLLR
jgi:hypothetical protein